VPGQILQIQEFHCVLYQTSQIPARTMTMVIAIRCHTN
jgi:hypothetical protein